MELLKWNDSFKLGIEELDEQHEKLIDMLNSFYESIQHDDSEREIEKALFTLASFAKYHFHGEEEMMEKHSFPGIRQQKLKNQEVRDKLAGLKEDFEKEGTNVQSEILKYMKSWIQNHVNEHIRTYAPYLKEKKLTGAGADKEIKTDTGQEEAVSREVFCLIPWRKDFEFGIEKIDEQHRRLADIINVLCDTINHPDKPSQTRRVINEVSSYIQYHFDYEEGLMARHKYKDIQNHIEQHEKLNKKFRIIEQRFTTFKTVVDHDLMIFLRDWFIAHTQTIDRRYIPAVTGQETPSENNSGQQ